MRDLEEFYTSCGWTLERGESGGGEGEGGALFGFLGHLTAKRGRDPIIILGFIVRMVS